MTCLSYIDSIKRVLANKSMWSQICNKHCKDLCPFTYQKIEAQKKKKKRNEAQKSRTLTSKQSISQTMIIIKIISEKIVEGPSHKKLHVVCLLLINQSIKHFVKLCKLPNIK